MHIAVYHWNRKLGVTRLKGYGTGGTLQEAMAACFVPIGNPRHFYAEVSKSEAVVVRKSVAGVIVEHWLGVVSGYASTLQPDQLESMFGASVEERKPLERRRRRVIKRKQKRSR